MQDLQSLGELQTWSCIKELKVLHDVTAQFITVNLLDVFRFVDLWWCLLLPFFSPPASSLPLIYQKCGSLETLPGEIESISISLMLYSSAIFQASRNGFERGTKKKGCFDSQQHRFANNQLKATVCQCCVFVRQNWSGKR